MKRLKLRDASVLFYFKWYKHESWAFSWKEEKVFLSYTRATLIKLKSSGRGTANGEQALSKLAPMKSADTRAPPPAPFFLLYICQLFPFPATACFHFLAAALRVSPFSPGRLFSFRSFESDFVSFGPPDLRLKSSTWKTWVPFRWPLTRVCVCVCIHSPVVFIGIHPIILDLTLYRHSFLLSYLRDDLGSFFDVFLFHPVLFLSIGFHPVSEPCLTSSPSLGHHLLAIESRGYAFWQCVVSSCCFHLLLLASVSSQLF